MFPPSRLALLSLAALVIAVAGAMLPATPATGGCSRCCATSGPRPAAAAPRLTDARQGWYEPGSQAREETPILFHELMAMIRATSAPTSAGLNSAATAS